jgi:hypothetical protein
MRHSAMLTISVLALTSFMATTALAQSPYFLRCSASGVNDDGILSVAFKIAGLGDNQTLTVTVSTSANATYGCLNNGQQCPNAANKVNVTGQVSASGTFTSGKNGQITDSLTVEPPDTALTCPPGQDLVLDSISYTNVGVTAPGVTGACFTSPGTFSADFFPQCR